MTLSTKVLALSLAVAIALQPSIASGAELQSPDLQLTPKALTIDGREGDWFPVEQSERILLRLERADQMELLLHAQDLLIGAQRTAIKTATTTLAYKDELILAERARGDEFREQFIKERDRGESLWRSPLLWFGIGTGLGVAVSIAIALLVRSSGVTIVER